jgi:hypothetical protein
MNDFESRELTRSERTDIKRLVTVQCANYDNEYGCLPLECPCYMLDKWWTGSFCKYFQNAVLPLDPTLESTLLSNKPVKMRSCKLCGELFHANHKRQYCTELCANRAQRKKQRNYMRKKRDIC